MPYPLYWFLCGFTLREVFELWKYKLKLFNPRTYEIFMIINLYLKILYFKYLKK